MHLGLMHEKSRIFDNDAKFQKNFNVIHLKQNILRQVSEKKFKNIFSIGGVRMLNRFVSSEYSNLNINNSVRECDVAQNLMMISLSERH